MAASSIPAIDKNLPPAGAAQRRPVQTKGRKPTTAGGADNLFTELRSLPWSELGIPLAVLAIVLAMIAPMPAFLLDALLTANITVSVIVLLVSIYITRPVDFSVFPTTLLLLTLFRLALNISSSRLILLQGNTGTAAAGEVIEAFGNFVVGGNYVIGTVIFLVLIAIQYVVINHGAVRISEVTARFTLDALPGKQMSIDSDLNAGLIDEAEARNRRKQLSAEAEFYGAMDGASRFTQRDAIASILITSINIIAGFLVGVFQHGLDLTQAIQTYTILTIGDGLVTVIPALMVSISGGLIVTRASSESKLGADVQRQVFSTHQPLLLAGGVLIAMAAFPGLPKIPFVLIGSGVGYAAWRMRHKLATAVEKLPATGPAAPAKEDVETMLRVEPVSVEVGLGLVKLVEGGQNSPLLRRIGAIRRQLVTDLGYVLPPVRVNDNLSLKAREYTILLKGIELARYEMPQGCELAIPGGKSNPEIHGTATQDPAFGIAALWVSGENIEKARQSGYTVVDAISVLGTHLSEVIRRQAHELFSRQDTKKLLDRVSIDNPKIVEDLVPKLLPLAIVQRVLQNLLRERVSIRDGASILEALGEAANITRNPVLLTEYVRQSLRRTVVKPYLNAFGELPAYLLDPEMERGVESAVEHTENSSHLNLAPQRIREILDRLVKAAGQPDNQCVVLTSSGARYFLRQIVESAAANISVISHSEVPNGVKVVSLGVI
jgi:flagellar biosynthesis protein FlhA